MLLDFTVAIPTYNGEKRLPDLLERLQSQVVEEKIEWEIVIVNNNSLDKTAEVIQDYQKNWKANCQLRYFYEASQGVTFARLRAVKEAQSELIGFLDDDVLPASNWVTEAVSFAKDHPQAGAWGSQIHGHFEVEPPANFERIKNFLAIRERGNKPNLYDPINLSLPPGAALVIRKQAWDQCIPEDLVFKGRLGTLMLAGDDAEILLHLHKVGWEIWYNSAMHVYHQIPRWRLEKEYLVKLARGCGLCICQLRFLAAKTWHKPIIFVRIFLGNLLRIVKHILKYKLQSRTDLIASVEMEFYFSSMMSPFFFIKCYCERLLGNIKGCRR